MLRGCDLIISQQWPTKLGTVFHDLESDRQMQIASKRLSHLPIIDPYKISAARESLENMRPLCEAEVEIKVHGQLLNVVFGLEQSSIEG